MSKPHCLYSIDNGNTNPHIAKYLNGELIEISPLRDFEITSIKRNEYIIVSNVGKDLELPKELNVITIPKLSNKIFLDMPVNYNDSLGEDRLYQSYYLYSRINKLNSKILLVDAGTFTTFDYITKKGHMGGHIFPGPQTFLNSYSYGENLPQIKIDNNQSTSIGNSTEKAIRNAVNLYNNSIINSIQKNYKADQIILTGGFSDYFKKIFIKNNLGENLTIDKELIHNSLYNLSEKLLPL